MVVFLRENAYVAIVAADEFCWQCAQLKESAIDRGCRASGLV